MELTERTEQRDTVVLTVDGVVDMAAAPALAQQIGQILRRHPRTLVIDLTPVTFLATAGMSVLAATQHKCEPLAIACGIVAKGPITERPMQLLALDQVLHLFPSVSAALAGANSKQR